MKTTGEKSAREKPGLLGHLLKFFFGVDWKLVFVVLAQYTGFRDERAWRERQGYRSHSFNFRTSTKWALVLGVAVTATKDQVKKAYRELCKKYHPDVCKTGEERMKEINNAYAEWEQYYQATA